MSDVAWVAPVAAAAGVAATAGVAWLLGRAQRSGRINTSEAASLWEESRNIREALRSEADGLRLRLTEAEKELAKTNTKLVETQMKLMTAHTQAELLRDEIRELRRLCGKTNADVEAVSRELHVIRSDTPEAEQARREAEGT